MSKKDIELMMAKQTLLILNMCLKESKSFTTLETFIRYLEMEKEIVKNEYNLEDDFYGTE